MKKIQFCSSIINLFQVYKMTFFRWIKYSYAFEYNVDTPTLLPARSELKKKQLLISLIYIYIYIYIYI